MLQKQFESTVFISAQSSTLNYAILTQISVKSNLLRFTQRTNTQTATTSRDKTARIILEADDRTQRRQLRREHFLPPRAGQLPNLKGIALHGSRVTELIFFQSNCVFQSRPADDISPPRWNLFACARAAMEIRPARTAFGTRASNDSLR